MKLWSITGNSQKLDGGAMFGVVPKPLWERRIPADERNRIQLGMRCLLIEHESTLILVDTGAGNKESAKFLDVYGRYKLGGGLSSLKATELGVAMQPHSQTLQEYPEMAELREEVNAALGDYDPATDR